MCLLRHGRHLPLQQSGAIPSNEAFKHQPQGEDMAQLNLDPDELKPLISEVVNSILKAKEQGKQLPEGKLAVSEPEAASFLGLNTWQLRDLRYRGGIRHRCILGGRIRYTLDDLQDYLDRCQRTGTE